jgi:hypothetical protein
VKLREKTLPLILALFTIFMSLLLSACENEIPAGITGTTAEPTQALATASPALPAPTFSPSPTDDQGDTSPYIDVTMLGIKQISQRQSENDLLTPVWREKTGIETSLVFIPEYMDYGDYLSEALRNESLPTVIALEDGIFDVPQRYALLKDEGVLWEISYEMVRENMPLTAQRLSGMGLSLKDWYDANIDLDAGVWLYVPSLPSPLFDESLRQTRYGIDLTHLPLSYVWVRDDILTSINPGALTALDVSVQVGIKGENLPIETILDWNINDFSSLTGYFESVQTLSQGLNLNFTPMRPVYSRAASSVIWSLFSAGGSTLSGDMPEFSADLKLHYSQTEGWKDYIHWLNSSNNLGYFGSTFSTTTETGIGEASHAIINWWLTQAYRAASPITGIEHGWRLYPLFIESALKDDKAAQVNISLRTKGAVGFNKAALPEEQLPALLKWVDWNYSLEAQELRSWGIGLSQGQGDSRRFTEEYSGVMQYMLSATDDPLDGWYYGLVNARSGSYEYWNHEVYGVGGSDVGPNAPFYVYPLEEHSFNQNYYVPYMVKKHLITSALEMQYIKGDYSPQSIELMEEISAIYEDYKAAFADEVTERANAALMEAIVCAPKDFQAKYAEYQQIYLASGAYELQKELEKVYNEIIH